jgi:membrane protease YdiL (CAAX protease family)
MAPDPFEGGPAPAPPSQADLRFGDLLLTLVVGLGVTVLAGVLAGALIKVSGLAGAGGPSDTQLLIVVALIVQAVGLLGAIYLFAVRRRGIAWAEFGLRPLTQGWLVRAVAIGLIAFVLASLFNAGVQSLMDRPPHNPQLDLIAPGGFSWGRLLVTLIIFGAVAPFTEEMFFRGLIYGWLRRRVSVWLAAGVSGLGFAVLHGIWWLIPALFVLGVALALIYERSGSIWASVITHGLFNSLTTVLYYLALATGTDLPA